MRRLKEGSDQRGACREGDHPGGGKGSSRPEDSRGGEGGRPDRRGREAGRGGQRGDQGGRGSRRDGRGREGGRQDRRGGERGARPEDGRGGVPGIRGTRPSCPTRPNRRTCRNAGASSSHCARPGRPVGRDSSGHLFPGLPAGQVRVHGQRRGLDLQSRYRPHFVPPRAQLGTVGLRSGARLGQGRGVDQCLQLPLRSPSAQRQLRHNHRCLQASSGRQSAPGPNRLPGAGGRLRSQAAQRYPRARRLWIDEHGQPGGHRDERPRRASGEA